MRTLYKDGKLNKHKNCFFETRKPKEELYNMKEDPDQLNNLADGPKYATVLKKLREKTREYDEIMKLVCQ